MTKIVEKKRKLEQEQAQSSTPKRLKPSNGDSSKKATFPINGAVSSIAVREPKPQTSSHANGTPRPTKEERKAAKKARRSNIQATPGAQLRAESDDVVTPVDKEKSKDAGKEPASTPATGQASVQSESKKVKKRKSLLAGEALQQTPEVADALVPHIEGEKASKPQRKADKKARRRARKQGELVEEAEPRDILPPKQSASGWGLSNPSAGRYLDHDPLFVNDGNGSACLIAATMREVHLLSLDTSLPIRSHIVPQGRHIVAYARSSADEQSIDIAYDNGTKAQWSWVESTVTNGTFPGQENVVAMTSATLSDGKVELFYIAESQGVFSVVGERKILSTTDRRLRSIQVLHNGAYIICTAGGAVVIGARKDPSPQSEYTWVDVPFGAPVRCVDARLVFKDARKKDQRKRPELMLAVGTAEGKILLYSNIASMFSSQAQKELPTPRILHWHREKVSAVKFSKDGNYLISGGKETVLVIWQLDTGKQQFLPHLTAEIENLVVSPEGNQYAVQMGDNSIMVLSTSELKAVANFAGLQLPVRTEQLAAEEAFMPKTPALLHPQDQHKLLLTVPATQPKSTLDVSARPFLQTFDVRNSRHISRQALSRNNVTDFNLGPQDTPIIPPDVSLIAISPDGQWMATVDEWEIPGTDLEHLLPKSTALFPEDLAKLSEEQQRRREVYLKFWRWDATQGVWTLSSRADGPHSGATDADPKMGAGNVLKLVADPSSDRFATVGQDSVVKIWTPKIRTRGGVPVKEMNGLEAIDWVCKRTIPIPTRNEISSDLTGDRQDSPMAELDESNKTQQIDEASLAFSPDGSMLACAQVADNSVPLPILHFIDADTGVLRSSKAGVAVPGQDVVDIGFLDRYFITLSTNAIRVWNLIDDSHHWTMLLPGHPEDQTETMLAVNPTDQTFAVVSHDLPENSEPVPKVSVYELKRATPIYETELSELPIALLAPQNGAGYTLLSEDASVRTLSTTSAFSTAIVQASFEASIAMPLALPSAETTSALAMAAVREADTDMGDATITPFSFSSSDVTATRPAIEDDKPVVRPEQLNAILDVGGQAFAMPALTEMFQALGTLHSRAPRRRVAALEKLEIDV